MPRPFRAALPWASVAFLVFSCSGGGGGSSGGGSRGGPVDLTFARIGGQFEFPVFLTSPPGDARLFVVEKGGTIRVLENDQQLPVPFLDIAGLVSNGDEQGLLGMAFDPAYAANGRFYVSYTDGSNATVISRYVVSGTDPDRADPASAAIVLTFSRPGEFHDAGMIAFGPDGKLYIASGDGGDPDTAPQSVDDLLGCLLRINVSGSSGYSIPSDNPFAGGGGRPEIWSYGLRNPWRFSFDRQTGDLYIGDVGHNQFEEIDVSTAATGGGRGANYGWSILEGTACWPQGAVCNPMGVVPVHEYETHQGGTCAVIGGYVYRGAAIPNLRGTYFYGDYCTVLVKSFRYENGQATEHRTWPTLTDVNTITSFGEDAAGELYVIGQDAVFRIVEN